MTHAASTSAAAGGRWARRSTLGGRSVPRAAAAVRGASLRSLPLTRGTALSVLTDPLARLRAGPPSLEAIAESAGRASGEQPRTRRGLPRPTASPLTVQRDVDRAAARPGPAPAPAPAPSAPPGTASRAGVTLPPVDHAEDTSTWSRAAGRRTGGPRRASTPDVATRTGRPVPNERDLVARTGAEGTAAAAVGGITAAAHGAAARPAPGPATTPEASGTSVATPLQSRADDGSWAVAPPPRVDAVAVSRPRHTTASATARALPRASESEAGALDELLAPLAGVHDAA